MSIGDIGNTLKDAALKVKDFIVQHKVTVLMIVGLFLALMVFGGITRSCIVEDNASSNLSETSPASEEVASSSEPDAGAVALESPEASPDTEEADMVIVELPSDQEPVYEAVTANPESAD